MGSEKYIEDNKLGQSKNVPCYIVKWRVEQVYTKCFKKLSEEDMGISGLKARRKTIQDEICN